MARPVFPRDDDTVLDDDELQRLIIDRLENDATFWMGRGARKTNFQVEVNDGSVVLRGTVKSQSDRRRADLLARALGALTVENRLRVAGDAEESAA
jgi:osmotically-inducible protein OsmY